MPGHDHAPHAARDNQKRVFWAMLLTGGFMLAEVVGGVIAGSLALIADAGHMLTDTASLALAWAAFRVGHWPRDARRTYGYHRFQVLAAFVNGLALIAIVGWIAIAPMPCSLSSPTSRMMRSSTALTYGQWLQMNITSRPLGPRTSSRV